MNRQALLDHLNAEAPALRRKYAVQSLAVFGSMARGDNREGSDGDILVMQTCPQYVRIPHARGWLSTGSAGIA